MKSALQQGGVGEAKRVRGTLPRDIQTLECIAIASLRIILQIALSSVQGDAEQTRYRLIQVDNSHGNAKTLFFWP